MSGIVEDIRINGGTVQKLVDGLWADVAVADDNDLLAETELRDNGCQLQYYDLSDGLWHDISNADYLSITNPCPITDQLQIITDNNIQLDIRHATSNKYIQLRQTGSSGVLRSENALQVSGGVNAATVFLDADGRVRFTTSAPTTYGYGAVTFTSTLNFPAFAARATHASAPSLFQLYDNAARLVVEAVHSGWFSVIQQMIVNDFTTIGTKRAQGRLLGQWADSADATRKGRLILQADDYAGAREGLRIEADGSEVILGFYGTTGTQRLAVTGTTVSEILSQLLDAVAQTGLVENQTEYSSENPIPAEVTMETHFEVLWDFTATQPNTNEVGIVVGNWFQGSGITENTIGLKEGVNISHIIDEYEECFGFLLQFQIANLSGGNVTLLAIFETNEPDTIVFADTYTDGIYQVQIPINMSSENERIDIKLYTDDNETANIAMEKLWKIGLGMPNFDRHSLSDYREVRTDVPLDFQLPPA